MSEGIRLVICDLDGTLLRSDKTVSPYTLDVLTSFAQKGGYFVPATGRAYEAIPAFLRSLPFIRYYICTNGASIYDKEKQKRLVTFAIAEALYQKLKKYRSKDVSLEVAADGFMFTEKLIDIVDFDVVKHYQYHYYQTRTLLPDIDNYLATKHSLIDKIQLIFKYDDERINALKEIEQIKGLKVNEAPGKCLEITAAAASKGNSAQYLAAYLKLPAEAILTFGDENNDRSLLMNFPHSVAPANAREAIKEIAKDCCLSNDQDGVARYLAAHCLAEDIVK